MLNLFYESGYYCSAPVTPLTTGLSICWQMRARRGSDIEGTQYSPYLSIIDYAELPPLQSKCHMTVKMASVTMFGGVLHLEVCYICFFWQLCWFPQQNSKSSMLPLAINTWPCSNATEKGQFYCVILILAMQLPSVHLVYMS